MNKALLRGLTVSMLSLLWALTLTGCWNPFAPDPGNNPEPRPPASYRLRTSPENVIHNLKTAYEYMNADEYLDCLAQNYIFFLNPEDLTNDPELPEYWDKAEERTIHENMFGDNTDVEGITLVFTYKAGVWEQGDLADPLDDTWDYIEGVDLRVQLPPDLELHADADGEFLFRIDPDEVGPDGELLWEIWKQWDLNERGRGDCGDLDDAVSLTTLKARFRE